MARPKRPRDPNQLAHLIVRLSTGQHEEQNPDAGKDPAAIQRGKQGGLKGGQARKAALSPEKRRQIARKAASARWNKH